MCKHQPQSCEHCFCQVQPGSAATYPHEACCMCGQRRVQQSYHPYWSISPQWGNPTLQPPYTVTLCDSKTNPSTSTLNYTVFED